MKNLRDMSLEEKIGQMIMIDFDGFTIDENIEKQLKKAKWGGVVLFSKNVKNREQLENLNKQLLNFYDIPMIISVDQEGGLVNRAMFDDMHLSCGNMALGKINDDELTEKVALISGLELAELGFNLNFSPVADVNINPNNPIIGVRSFGENAGIVSKMSVATIKGYEKAGIGSCAKHFPGHGDTVSDSHLCLPSVEADIDRINAVELEPFRACVNAGVSSIMTAHVLFKAIDKDYPATLSKKILTGILREKMRFDGLVITDSMSMKAIADNYGLGESAVLTVKAGADMVMMCGTFEEQMLAYDYIMKAVKAGDITEETIDKAVERILKFKEKYVVNRKNEKNLTNAEKDEILADVSKKAVDIMYGEDVFPLDKEKSVLVLSPNKLYATLLDEYTEKWSIYPYLKDEFASIKHLVYDLDNPDFKIDSSCDIVILELYSRGVFKGEILEKTEKFLDELKQKNIKSVILSLASPYGIPKNADACITAYNYLQESLKAMSDKVSCGLLV